MYMYTSCGWFFDEISGLETTQCLHYAARAIHLARHFGRDCERRFVQTLKTAPEQPAQVQDGRGVWEQLIQPAVVDLDRVLAHYAISLIFPDREPERDLTRPLRVRPRRPEPGGPQPGQQPPGPRAAAGPLAPDLGRGGELASR